MKKNKNLLLYVTIILIVLLVLLIYNCKSYEGFEDKPELIITDIHVINLDRSPERWKKMQEEVKKLGDIPIKRWKAVDGKELSDETIKDICKYEVSSTKGRIPGEVGCYLSHKTLLEHLRSLPVSPDAGHLILEDDAKIDDNFMQKWNAIKLFVPLNWEMIYFGAGGTDRYILKKENIKNGIGELKGGLGTYGYIVKHSTIPKFLELINVMNAPIDVLYNDNFKILNVYILEESLIVGLSGENNDSNIG